MNVAAAALEGTLEDFSIASLLRFLAGSQHSGTLTIAAAQATVICLDQGRITLAGAADVEQLRTGLISAGVVRADGWEAAVRSSRQGGRPLTEELVRSGATMRATLADALYEQTVNTVFELLLPSAAPFWFVSGVDHPLGEGHRFDNEAVIADAQRRLRTWKRIAEVIPSTSIVVRLAEQLPLNTELVTLSREEWPVLAAVDGRRDVAAIITHTGLSAFGVCGVLHRFITSGIATVTR
jgi:hypothetical protein